MFKKIRNLKGYLKKFRGGKQGTFVGSDMA